MTGKLAKGTSDSGHEDRMGEVEAVEKENVVMRVGE
jgi:hypothetical protein